MELKGYVPQPPVLAVDHNTLTQLQLACATSKLLTAAYPHL